MGASVLKAVRTEDIMSEEIEQPEAEAEATAETLELTQQEFQSRLDAEADRRVEKVLSKKQAEWDKQLQERLAEAENKGAEYAKMTAAEKAQAEMQERLEQLEKREHAIKQRELSASVASDLAEQGLPVELADSLTAIGDPAAIKNWVSTIKDTISEAVNEQVKERLNTGKPTSTATNLNASDDPFAAIAAKYK